MTFNDIWGEYIAQKRKRVKPSTVSAYIYTWQKIKDFFGEKELSSITTKMVEKWVLDQLDSLSRKTVKDRLVFVNNIIDWYCYEYEENVSKINIKYIHWPTINSFKGGQVEQTKTFTAEDIRQLLAKIAEDPQPYNMCIAIMIATGIRIGEACALKYRDVNLETKSIEIGGTIERIRKDKDFRKEDCDRMGVEIISQSKGSVLILSTPKCVSSRRSIPLPSELVKILKKFKEIYPPDYYIGSNKFKPREPRTLRECYYQLLESAGVSSRLSPHSLRHTYATNLITSGIDVKTTAALLGHGDTSTTLAIYSHATSESKRNAMSMTVGKQFRKILGNQNKIEK